MSTPKRDKFAALAASQSATGSSLDEDASAVDQSSNKAGATAAAARGGGKFAALQKANTTTAIKRDKFSALASRSTEPETVITALPTTAEVDTQEWTRRSQQREQLWKDLEQAEIAILEFLDHTQETVDCLAHQTTTTTSSSSDNTERLRALATKIPKCIQQIHGKLAPAAKFIQAYQAPQRTNRLYQVRVEEGLAVQKQGVLQELVELEKKRKIPPVEGEKNELSGKRKREETSASA